MYAIEETNDNGRQRSGTPQAASLERTRVSVPLSFVDGRSSSGSRFEVLAHCIPVYDVPNCFQIFRPPILVLEVVRVFPNVDTQQRLQPVHYRTVLICRRSNFQTARFVNHQPGPAAAESARTSSLNLLFELVETAER